MMKYMAVLLLVFGRLVPSTAGNKAINCVHNLARTQKKHKTERNALDLTVRNQENGTTTTVK